MYRQNVSFEVIGRHAPIQKYDGYFPTGRK